MVLNLFRVPDINPKYMLEKSFYQFQNYAAIPSLRQSLFFLNLNVYFYLSTYYLAMREKQALLSDANASRDYEIEAYYNLEKRIQHLQQSVKSKILKPSKVVPFFQPGRLLKVF
jgi:ATP-dependent RNA helicase DOB1